MASDRRQNFKLSGPLHLTHIDWQNLNHKRSVIAALVKGVYVLEKDRKHGRHGPSALAPPWWEHFDFQLNQVLVDDTDHSFFGAIYKYKRPNSDFTSPRYIIAFRGIQSGTDTVIQDLELVLKDAINSLHNSSRFQLAIQAVQKIVSIAGPSKVWLAGHSLGSTISLRVGRYMVKMGYHLETYLFNSPFISIPIELIKNKKVKNGIRITGSIIKAGLATIAKSHSSSKSKENEQFEVLSSWIPYLFLNPHDHICSEYIGYFDHRKKMESIGFAKIEKLATQNSFGSMFLGAIGRESEPSHLFPSAYLTINLGATPGFCLAHRLEQWWSADLISREKLHQFLKFHDTTSHFVATILEGRTYREYIFDDE